MHNKKKYLCLYFVFICCVFFNFITATAPSVFVNAKPTDGYIDVSIAWPSSPKFTYEEKDHSILLHIFDAAELLTEEVVEVVPGANTRIEDNKTTLALPNTTVISAKKTDHIIQIRLKRVDPPKPQPAIAKKDYPSLDMQRLIEKVAQHFKTTSRPKPKPLARIWMDDDRGMIVRYPQADIAAYLHQNTMRVIVKTDEAPSIDTEETPDVTVTAVKGGFMLSAPFKGEGHKFLSVKKSSIGWQFSTTDALPSGDTPYFLGEGEGDKLHLLSKSLSPPIRIDNTVAFCTSSPQTFVPFGLKSAHGEMLSTSAGAVFIDVSEEALSYTSTLITWDAPEGKTALHTQNKDSDILTLIQGAETQSHFLAYEQQLLSEITNAKEDALHRKMALVLFYVENLFHHEAVDLLQEISEQHPNFEQLDLPILYAIMMSSGGDYLPLEDTLNRLYKKVYTHPVSAAWYGLLNTIYAHMPLPKYLAIELKTIIKEFPNPLKTQLLITLADVMHQNGYLNLAKEMLPHISVKYLTAPQKDLHTFLEIATLDLAASAVIPDLEALLENTTNVSMMARILMHPSLTPAGKRLSDTRVALLETLIPELKGSWVQQAAMQYLMNVYVHKKDYLKVLDQAMLLKTHHPEAYQKSRPVVENIVNGIIQQQLYHQLGLVQTLNLLNTFTDLIASSESSLDFLVEFTSSLSHIGLITESIQLLETFTKHSSLKVSPLKQFNVYEQLLSLYIKNQAAERATEMMEVLDTFAEKPENSEERLTLLKARLALLNQNTDMAIQHLQTIDNQEGLALLVDLLWEKRQWSKVVTHAEKLLNATRTLDVEKQERYLIQMATAIVLNAKGNGYPPEERKAITERLQALYKDYAFLLSKYKKLFQFFIDQPMDSYSEEMTLTLVENELKETERIDQLFQEVTHVETH